MFILKREKIVACAIAILLIVGTVSFPLTVTATSTTAETAKPSDGGQPPAGEAPSGNPPGDPPSGGMGGAHTMTYDYPGSLSGALTADGTSSTSDSETYTASNIDQNAALVQNAGTLTITNDTFQKSGDDTNGDNCNFYGINSILLAVNEDSTAYISDSTLNSDSEGSNGIFATDNSTVYSNNNTITTTAGNSRGLDATYSGNIIANSMIISTKGDHSAAIATDRGGGNISTTNSTLSTQGSGSPLLYSTGDIEVDNITGTSAGSQIAGMEGLNTILIHNSNLTSSITGKTASDPIANGIIIYQSTSGDAESTTGSTATFQASDSTLKSSIESGSMFYLTNTAANIVLNNTVLDFNSDKANLITIQGNDSNNWGTAGNNGAEVTFTGIGETLSGNIDVDTISSLNMYLLDQSTYTGFATISTNAVNTNQTSSPITINLDSTSKWVVTANTTISNLNAEKGATIVDESGNTVSIVANGETVVSGTSKYTITVTQSYSTDVITDSTNQLSTSYIDRSAFDTYYNVSTTFGNNMLENAEISQETKSNNDTSTAQSQESSPASTTQNWTPFYIAMGTIIILIGGGFIISKKRKSKN